MRKRMARWRGDEEERGERRWRGERSDLEGEELVDLRR